MGESRASARKIRGAERRRRALELRKQGLSYAEIGRELGITAAAARFSIRKALEDLHEEIRQESRELIALQIARLEELYARLNPRIQEGDVDAIRVAVHIVVNIARLLGADRGGPQTGPTIIQFIRMDSGSGYDSPASIKVNSEDPAVTQAG